MKSIALLIAVGVPALLTIPTSGKSQQVSAAYSHPLGIHQPSTPSHSLNTVSVVEPVHKTHYVVIGALLGGAVGAGLIVYEFEHGGSECICNPIPAIAFVVGGGLVVGGVLGLITYYIIH